MATPDDIDTDLTLEIDGRNVPPGKFLRGARAFFGVLDEVTNAVCGDSALPEWAVQVKSGSNLVGVRPIGLAIDPTVIDLILTKVRTGIETLEDRSEAPPDFPIRAIRHLRDLGKIEGEGDGEDTKIKVAVALRAVAERALGFFR